MRHGGEVASSSLPEKTYQETERSGDGAAEGEVPLEPFSSAAHATNKRSFSQPDSRLARGCRFGAK